MKLRISAILLALLLLLSACTPNTPPIGSETAAGGTSGGATTEGKEPEVTTPKDDVKFLTDTDTPDKSTRLELTYDSYDKLGLKYAQGALGALYDGNINSRLSYYTPAGKTTYNAARLSESREIRYIKLFCAVNYDRNIGAELQASVDGKEYVTLHTLAVADSEAMKEGPLVIEVENETKFQYFRVYHREASGYDLNEIELYGTGISYQRVMAEYLDFGDGVGGKNLSWVYGTESIKGKEDGLRLIWDGITDTTYCNYHPGPTAKGAWVSAVLPEGTVIGKLVLATIWAPANNLGTAIQASVDGESWTTLYTLSADDGSFVEGASEWNLETLEIFVEDDTAYKYIRVFDTAGGGFCFSEVEVFRVFNVADVKPSDPEQYPKTTVSLNSSVAGVQILGERYLASDQAIHCDWSCSGIELTLSCVGTVSFAVSATEPCYFRVYVDGLPFYNESSPYYTVKGSTDIVLQGIPEGEHTVRLLKVTGFTLSNAQLQSVTFCGRLSETAPADKDYYIEFVGDSITCAWGTVGNGGGSYEGQDGTLAYSYLIAKEQNADYAMTALSGQGLLCGTPGVPLGYLYASWKKDGKTEYDFQRKADLVVINIGTNDFYQQSKLGVNAEDFKTAYREFLATVKEKNGADCKILCLYNCMNDGFANEIKRLCKELGGAENGYYCYQLERAAGNSVSSGHPTMAEQASYAEVLNPIVTEIRNGTYHPVETVEYTKVKAEYLTFADGNGNKTLEHIYGTESTKGKEDALKWIWDGVTDTTYCNYHAGANVKGAWTTAKLPKNTVIGKLVLATIWMPANNLGTAIQASVDGEAWVTLHTVTAEDGSFAEGKNEWKLKTLEILVNDPTAYNFIRVYDTAGGGFCLAEVEIYALGDPTENEDRLKILAIGNSFSEDATTYLWEILNNGGVKATVANLHIGGCTLDRHWENIQNESAAYTYSKNTNGAWVKTSNYTILNALMDEDWDVITVQQASGSSGKPETYTHLAEILSWLNDHKRNADAKIYWHMTWAYQSDSAHGSFADYGKDQIAMYQAIVGAVQSKVLPNGLINGVIPAGTAVQNLRTSYIGDTLTRDGHHMSEKHGRYLTALTWYAYLTGNSVEEIDWVPAQHVTLKEDLAAIREAVSHALATPYAVTKSQFLKAPVTVSYERVETTYITFDDGHGNKTLEYIYGTESTKGKEDALKWIWDGKTDNNYCNYLPHNNTSGAWTSASLPENTVIGKLVLATIWAPSNNLGTAIQASVDGETWVTLHTVTAADGSFAEGKNEWKLETLEILVNDPTAYHYIRVYDTAGGGFCLAEVEVYTISES